MKKKKALIFLGTLKSKKELSHTDVLCEILSEKLEKEDIHTKTIRLQEQHILPGVESDMGPGDSWPQLLEEFLAHDIIIFATPIWWGNHSSLMQQVIERLDALDDERLETGTSRIAGKVAGIVITGADDGAEHITGSLSNFFISVGFTIPPFCSLGYLGDMENKTRAELKTKLKKEMGKKAEVMVENLKLFAGFLEKRPLSVPQ